MNTVGINEIINFEELKIYPNPVKDYVTIEFTKETSNYKIEIVNLLGQAIYKDEDVSAKEEIDLKFIPNGIYYLKIQNALSQKTFKLVKE